MSNKKSPIESMDFSAFFGKKVAVAVSGGVDSMVLLDLLYKEGCQPLVLHCNFHLRGEESDRETALVVGYCQANGLDFRIRHFYKSKKDENTQLWAREQRYSWFDQVANNGGLDYVAIAHHREDNSETALINFLRGTGIKGVKGMTAQRGYFIRPMLNVSRQEIVEYADKHEILFSNDSSNDSSDYLRNYIRNEFLPKVEQGTAGVLKRLSTSTQNLQKVYSYWKKGYDSWRSSIDLESGFVINNKELEKEHENGFLSYYLSEVGFSGDQIERLNSSMTTGATLVSGELTLEKRRDGYLLYKKKSVGSSVIDINHDDLNGREMDLGNGIVLKISSVENDDKIKYEQDTCFIPRDKIQGGLFLRHWENGDVFVPLGMKGQKKLSDYFIDNKFSRKKKDEVWLLCDQKNIIWIAGERLDERYKVDPDSKALVKLVIQS